MFHDMPLNLHVDYITFSNKITNNMNKIKLIPLALAAFMFSACSSEDTENGGGNNNVDVSYLSVNIQNVGEAMSRAENEEYEDGKGGTYEDGTAEESKISNVRFYFFNADGSPYLLNNTENKTINWLTPEEDINSTDKDHNQTVEQIAKTVLVINGKTKTAPHSVVAVINNRSLTNTTLGDKALTLSELRSKQDVKFYNVSSNKTTDFVMANSIYMKDGKEEYAVPVSGHVATDADAAKNNPIDIYVERVAAKVNITCDKSKNWFVGTENWNKDKWTYKLPQQLNDKYEVYVVVDGWGVADENGRANVEKVISTTWNNNDLGINPWTTGDYHRCFWETSVAFSKTTPVNSVVNHSFNEINANVGTPVYTLPNTPAATNDFKDKMENSLTKVIVAAHLWYKDEAGVAHQAEICKYKGIQYLSKEDVLTVVANENKSKYFKKTGKDEHGKDVYTSISKDDLTFATSAPAGATAILKDYEVVPQLKEGITVYNASHTQVVPATDVNKDLAIDANKAQIRTEGRVYYYTPIRHLAATDTKLGYYGVVRNHSYKINIQDVSGFGTPVYDPEKVIDPTLPEEKDVYLAARINVLSWRVVKSDVNLDSNKKK